MTDTERQGLESRIADLEARLAKIEKGLMGFYVSPAPGEPISSLCYPFGYDSDRTTSSAFYRAGNVSFAQGGGW